MNGWKKDQSLKILEKVAGEKVLSPRAERRTNDPTVSVSARLVARSVPEPARRPREEFARRAAPPGAARRRERRRDRMVKIENEEGAI